MAVGAVPSEAVDVADDLSHLAGFTHVVSSVFQCHLPDNHPEATSLGMLSMAYQFGAADIGTSLRFEIPREEREDFVARVERRLPALID